MGVSWAFHLYDALSCAFGGGQMVLTKHGQGGAENQICVEMQIHRTARRNRSGTTTQEETMQFKHVTLDFDGSVAVLKLDHQEVMNAVSIDMLGGLGRGARRDRREESRGALPRAHRRRPGVLHRRQPAGPQQAEAGQEQCRGGAGDRVPSVPAAAAQSALPDRHGGQWPGRRRRHELCADGRHDPVRALRLISCRRSAASAWCRIAARPGCCRA